MLPCPGEEIGEKLEKTLIIRDRTLKNGFTPVPNVILESKSLSLGAKVLYALLLRYAWQNSEAFPGQGRLAESTGCTERTIRTYLTELKNAGLISWKRRGLTKTNIYYINDLKEFLDRKSTSGQEGKKPERNNNTLPDRKSRSAQNRKRVSDKEYPDQKDTDQEDTDQNMSLDSNPSLRSELESKLRTPNSSLLDDLEGIDVPDELFEDDGLAPDNETETSGSYQADLDLSKAPEREKTYQPNTDACDEIETPCYDKSFNKAPGRRTDHSRSRAAAGCGKDKPFPGAENNNNNSYPDNDIPGELEPSEPDVNLKKSPGRDDLPVVEAASAEKENDNHSPGADTTHCSVGTSVDNPSAASCSSGEEGAGPGVTPRLGTSLTAGDIIAMLGDSLREVMRPPAKAYAIAGRLYNLYDFPAAESAINTLKNSMKNGNKIRNPVPYLMKVAREKKAEFETESKPDEDEQPKLFSRQYPDEDKKRLEEVKKIYAERERNRNEYLSLRRKAPKPVAGFASLGDGV